MVDKSENILVEFDYNNITIIDPNKVVDSLGKVKDRYIKQEDLVMYANLECKVIPRTKLAVGVASNDQIQTVSVAEMNFLKPGGKDYLDTSWTNELTGKDSLVGKAENQVTLKKVNNPNKSNDTFLRQTMSTGGKVGSIDNNLLGIQSIQIKQGTDFLPVITIKLVDIKGRALFEGADNSPYGAFFNLPYPLFHLTIKGYYGKAVKLPLMLQNFTSSFNSQSSNFDITLTFITYKYSMLAEVQMGSLLALPYMYKSQVNFAPVTNTNSDFKTLKPKSVSRGYEKIKEVYSEYKSKGIIDDDFPEMTIRDFQNKLDNFLKNIMESLEKVTLSGLTDLDIYENNLKDYQNEVYYSNKSWFKTYVDEDNYYVLNSKDNNQRVYLLKSFINTPQKREDAFSKLNTLVQKYNKLLLENPTLGLSGNYKVEGKTYNSSIPFDISINNFYYQVSGDLLNDVNLEETYKIRFRTSNIPTQTQQEQLKAEIMYKQNIEGVSYILVPPDNNSLEKVEKFYPLWFDTNPKTFLYKIDEITKSLRTKRTEIEGRISDALNKIIQSKSLGIGFVPSIRNVLAVILSNAEAFLRVMDDVHTAAWNKSTTQIRKNAIFDKTIATASPDTKDVGSVNSVPVYPWPQYIVATSGENGKEKYEVAYPGDPKYINRTKGFDYDSWPEVEFVEEWIKGFSQRVDDKKNEPDSSNEENDVKRITFNAIEFPVRNIVYSNKEEVKFFFELYERMLILIYYSKFSRSMTTNFESAVNSVITESEVQNLVISLGTDNPFLTQKFTQYGLNSQNFLPVLQNFSNGGQGQSWQNFIRGIYNTPYIKNLIDNSQFEIINYDVFDTQKSKPLVSLTLEDKFVEFITGTTSNQFDFTDIYPFTDLTWIKSNLSDGKAVSKSEQSYGTTNVLKYDKTQKIISNFEKNFDNLTCRPFSNFLGKTGTVPSTIQFNTKTSLSTFYKNRKYWNQLYTEGNVRYTQYNGGKLSYNQTTSILNTPFFINALQQGVESFVQKNANPYIVPAYYFLNSLPLATLKEKYKTYNNGAVTDLDYIFSTMKKFGAVHKVPYAWVLKMGSIWYRYKTYKETGNDILQNSWTGFNATENFDPVTQNKSKVYTITLSGVTYDFVLERNVSLGPDSYTTITTGFYPKTINDLSIFYKGKQLYTGYTSIEIQSGFTNNINLSYVPNAGINYGKGFDPNNPNRDLTIIPWSISLNTDDNKFLYVIPSHGCDINQTKFECFNEDGKMIVEVTGNTAMYNGSTRLFWVSPNYGYFDSNNIAKVKPDEYLKRIIVDTNKQENFSLNGLNLTGSSSYSSIEEIFSLFDKNVLDVLEQEFLKFTISIYDYKENVSIPVKTDDILQKNKTSELTSQKYLKNFQAFFRQLMLVPKNEEKNPTLFVEKIMDDQSKRFGVWMDLFMSYDVVLKFGNPSFFDRRAFFSLSSLNMVDKIKYQTYNLTTPNALPSNGGTTTLSSSKINHPAAWEALEKYVGFSTINELVYSNNGSFITDFFIDMDIAFNETNVKLFSPLIKSYATQKLKQFRESQIPPIQPSATIPEPIIAYATLTDGTTAQVIKGPSSLINIIDKRRVRLLTLEGKTIDISTAEISTKTNRELIVDAITNFYGNIYVNPIVGNVTEVPLPSYPLVPNTSSKYGRRKFVKTLNDYLKSTEKFKDSVLNNVLIQVGTQLPKVVVDPIESAPNTVQGTPTPLELWDSFKSFNDKWISGTDVKSKTLFEDIMILDRANRDIGNKFFVDIELLKNRMKNIPVTMSVKTFVNSILEENRFVVMNLPSYMNFYGIQDPVKNGKPKVEPLNEFANSLFGTFTNVDYRNSTSKMICIYGGKPSSHLEINKNIDYRYRNDSFDITKAADNPVVDSLKDKTDHALSNKVVGFNVDIGPQNQGVFSNFSVSQEQGLATAESMRILNDMANLGGNRAASTQSNSLFNVYKNRSYSCSVEMMGNAMIQPTMYFNLRYVPMFSGPYMITGVEHTIGSGDFKTRFTGVRQPVANLPILDNYLQTLLKSLVKIVKDEIEQQKQKAASANAVTSGQTANSVNAQASEETKTGNNSGCVPTITNFTTYEPTIDPPSTILSARDMATNVSLISNTFTISNKDALGQLLFISAYIGSWNGTNFSGPSNNFTNLTLTTSWGGQNTYLNKSKKYYCGKNSSTNLPFAVFENTVDNLEMLANYLKNYVVASKVVKGDVDKLTDLWTKNVASKGAPVGPGLDTQYIKEKVKKALILYDELSV